MVDKQKTKPGVSGLDSTGRYIEHDGRGNAVWKWRAGESDDPTDIDRTFSLLKSLDNDALQIEDTQISKVQDSGVDPYNSPLKKSKLRGRS